MTGFEPATLRPPDVYATRLRHIPNYYRTLSVCFSGNRFSKKKLLVGQPALSKVEGLHPDSGLQIKQLI